MIKYDYHISYSVTKMNAYILQLLVAIKQMLNGHSKSSPVKEAINKGQSKKEIVK